MRILFLSRWFPYPADNGSKIRIFNVLRHLAQQHEVVLLSFANEPVQDGWLAALRQICQRVETVPYRAFQPGRLTALTGFVARRPRSVVDTFHPAMQALVADMQRAQPFDLVIASQIDMAIYALGLPETPKLFEEVELTTFHEHLVRPGSSMQRLRRRLTWWKLTRYIDELLQTFDGCTVVSAQEQALVERVRSSACPVTIIPNGVDVAHYAQVEGTPQADTLLYTGALSYGPNFDAVAFFLHEILPHIRRERPDARLSITGKVPETLIETLPQRDGVCFTGYLDDMRPALAQSWVSIVPLRRGGGTRLKILESLAAGTPVVTTSKGVEGLDLVPERDLLVADDPQAFAAAVVRLLHDPALRERLSHNGRQTVAARYDWQMIGAQFNDLVAQIAKRHAVEIR